jgi:multimeric flavodoxin WrbA
MTKLLFICGSPRNASTEYAVLEAKKGAESVEGVEVTMLNLRGKKIAPCVGCNACVKKGVTECIVYQDDMQEWNRSFFNYDGVLIGSPVYEMGITPQLATFFSRFRAEYLNQKDDPLIRMYMPGAALAVGGTRNGGQESVIRTIHGFYSTYGLPIVTGGLGVYCGASIWSQDRMAQGAAEDEKGMGDARLLGKRLALTAKALQAAKPQN